MKFLVTGGAGFIGSHIVEALIQNDHDVVIFDNLSSGTLENIRPFLKEKKAVFVQGDITDLSQLLKITLDVDGIFHEAAIASVQQSVKDPLTTHNVNATGILNVLTAAMECGVKKVVCASTAAVYGDNPSLPKREEMMLEPMSPYAVSKLTGEYYCSVFSQLYGIHTVSLRYFNVFGPHQDPNSEYSGVISKFIARVSRKEPITIFGDGEQTRDFVFVKDVVTANLLAMEHNVSGIFNIGGGGRLSLNELAATIKEIFNADVPIRYEHPREGDIRHSCADISKAREILGYVPKYPVKDGLEKTVAQLS